jgi:hypothetical protein
MHRFGVAYHALEAALARLTQDHKQTILKHPQAAKSL